MNYNFKRLVISRLIAENILLLLLQLMGMKFSVLSNPPLPIDFAAGTAAAFIFMRGYTILPGIWIGSWLVSDSILATAYTLQTGLLFFLCVKLVSPGLVFLDKKLFLRFALLCLLVALLFSPFMLSWQSNLAGLLTVTLAITNWDMYFPEMANWRRLNDFRVMAVLFILALIINIVACLGYFNHMNNISLFLCVVSFILIFSSIRPLNME